jgi:hypothetical protein
MMNAFVFVVAILAGFFFCYGVFIEKEAGRVLIDLEQCRAENKRVKEIGDWIDKDAKDTHRVFNYMLYSKLKGEGLTCTKLDEEGNFHCKDKGTK